MTQFDGVGDNSLGDCMSADRGLTPRIAWLWLGADASVLCETGSMIGSLCCILLYVMCFELIACLCCELFVMNANN